MSDKVLMLGNEAVARGVYEAGARVVSSYPGTPSTEITEFLSKYDDLYSEWAPNEKVAAEVAIGASFAGARSFCAMKHVGFNVAADPLYTASYIGVGGGMVVAVADDPSMHSSQNEQDSRNHAKAAKLPMLEPGDSAECRAYAKLAFELSERFDTPVLLKLTTRVSHARSLVETQDRVEVPLKKYEKNVAKNVMMPAMAKKRRVFVEERMEKLTEYAETSGINRIEWGDRAVGIIAAGGCYTYAREALGDKASYLKLGMVNPLPVDLIEEFADGVETLYVVEEMDDVIETHCRKNGIDVLGKEVFPVIGEFSAATVRDAVLGAELPHIEFSEPIPGRPPVLCAGCPHRGVYYALKGLGLFVSGDIGCYTLGAAAPLSGVDTCVCMGASISGLHGYNTALGADAAKKSVAVIGDSTFCHSGITGLVDIAYNKGISTVIVLDNSITGMTGHQNNPLNGKTIKGDPTTAIDLEALAHAIGIARVRVVDSYDVDAVRSAVLEELAAEAPSLIIARRPCALLKDVKHKAPLAVDADACKGCRACLQVGCPALSFTQTNGKKHAVIDAAMCVGCGICQHACKFSAIGGQAK
ncbi:MAG: indolepyruvate ferredoxin oxidoreductase subunit alpha [Oscillospiraceae bacterium]|nr:indolepyruvate ferredoxin oxidoreductase subunit alpha [Oscillospiraceae bacterium]